MMSEIRNLKLKLIVSPIPASPGPATSEKSAPSRNNEPRAKGLPALTKSERDVNVEWDD